MLRRICGKCNSIIDGEPKIDKEFADAVLVIDDEIACIFDDLCPKCKAALRKSVETFMLQDEEQKPPRKRETGTTEPENTPPRPPEEQEPEETDHRENASPTVCTDGPEPAETHRTIDKESLPNKVVKKYTVKLNPPHSGR